MNKNRILIITVGIIIFIISSFFIVHLISDINTDHYKVDDDYTSNVIKESKNIENKVEIIDKTEVTTPEAITEKEQQEEIVEEQKQKEPIEVIESVEKPIKEETNQQESKKQEVKEETTPEEVEPETLEETVPEEDTNETIEEITEETIIHTGNEWADEKVNEHIDEIEEEDLNAGVSISEKLDIEKITELLEDGLTEEEKENLKTYLLDKLTEEEYKALIDLFGKYNYILE